ncbi:methyltransferase family protein [[Pseudomonas] boreopolis]|uniref:methyltransferase family protein n=1 Tax=Xanthomonas boreopolis TaxID=86183 RepID=UPI003D3CBA41
MPALSPHLPFLLLNLAWGGYEILLGHRRRAADGGARDQGTLKMLWRVLYGAIALGVAVSFLRSGRFPAAWIEPLRWSGCVLVAGGLAFRIWAIRTLDRWFTVDVTIQQDQPLIQHGPYRRLRHPSYTGALLAFCGLALGLGSVLSVLAIVPAATWAFLRRIRVEEAALREAFGARYDAYAATRWRLLPGVW